MKNIIKLYPNKNKSNCSTKLFYCYFFNWLFADDTWSFHPLNFSTSSPEKKEKWVMRFQFEINRAEWFMAEAIRETRRMRDPEPGINRLRFVSGSVCVWACMWEEVWYRAEFIFSLIFVLLDCRQTAKVLQERGFFWKLIYDVRLVCN